MTCTRPGPFPPSSYLPIFRHIQMWIPFIFLSFLVVIHDSHYTPPLLGYYFSSPLRALPHPNYSFQSAQHSQCPQITVRIRIPLSQCSSSCILCKTTARPQNSKALFISCDSLLLSILLSASDHEARQHAGLWFNVYIQLSFM